MIKPAVFLFFAFFLAIGIFFIYGEDGVEYFLKKGSNYYSTDNILHKKNLMEFKKKFDDFKKEKNLTSALLNELPGHSSKCLESDSKALPENCLQYLIEGENLQSAKENAENIKKYITQMKREASNFIESRLIIVLIPATRKQPYSGPITPKSASHFF